MNTLDCFLIRMILRSYRSEDIKPWINKSIRLWFRAYSEIREINKEMRVEEKKTFTNIQLSDEEWSLYRYIPNVERLKYYVGRMRNCMNMDHVMDHVAAWAGSHQGKFREERLLHPITPIHQALTRLVRHDAVWAYHSIERDTEKGETVRTNIRRHPSTNQDRAPKAWRGSLLHHRTDHKLLSRE